jgi:hypothetical protein
MALFVCTVCAKSYATNYALRKHVKQVHRGSVLPDCLRKRKHSVDNVGSLDVTVGSASFNDITYFASVNSAGESPYGLGANSVHGSASGAECATQQSTTDNAMHLNNCEGCLFRFSNLTPILCTEPNLYRIVSGWPLVEERSV